MKKIDLRKPLIVLLAVVLVFMSVFIVKNIPFSKSVDLTKGRQYIKAQEKLSVEEIEDAINERKSGEFGAMDLENPETIFNQFQDYAFYGDSRVLHFASYGFLPTTRLFAENGYAFQDVKDWDYRLRSIKPSVIYLAYGSNDINRNIYTGNNAKAYKEVVMNAIEHIQEICPEAQLYVLGMIPPNALGQSQLTQFKMYKSLNLIYQEVCEEMDNCTYIDDEVLGEDGMADIFTDDGFHFVKEFYPIWAKYILEHSQMPTKQVEE
ncbi:MAG: SGNH/GDSL hydrolase family protein [Bacillota bacterium]|nr:SGNH/GDSL hydrolase family protein [Bacillota bacterium]